jgi:hypothetical protein
MPPRYPEFWESDETRLWSNVSHGHTSDYESMKADSQAIELFSAGWIEDGFSPEQRQAIRDEFFDYAIEQGYFYDREDFDWEAWREYMGY